MAEFEVQCKEHLEGAKHAFFSDKCVVGSHRADAGKEGEATMAKLVRMTAARGEGSGVLGVMAAWQLPDTLRR